jgi:Cu/Ag efflux pump CusA
MRWVIVSSVKYRLLLIAVAATLLVSGAARLRDAPVEALPDFGPVRVEVQTEALGLSPEEVENLISNPMEQEFFNGIPWLHKIRSDSLPSLSSIEMIFEPGTDSIRARQVVQERLTMVPALPQVSKPPFVIQPVATTGRLLMIGLSSEELSLIDLSVLARWKIKQRLLRVPGVANVSIWGLRDRQLQVLVEPERLRQNRLKVDNVVRTAGNAMWSSPLTYVEASTPGTGGLIDTANQRISVQHIQPIQTAKHLAQVTIEGAEKRSLTLGQVAEIVENHPLLTGDAIVQGSPGVLLVVERFPDTSISRLTRDVERALDAMRPGLSGIEIDTTIFRPASFVAAARDNLTASLGTGLVLLGLLIGAFLFNWRAALIAIVPIALSLAAAWLVLSASGAMLNMMIVAGLVMALAVVVDDAIVDVDNIRRRLRQRRAEGVGASALETIVATSQELRGPMLWATAIVVISVVPVLVLGEVSGAFVRPLTLSYALAVIVSMVVALTVTPALAVALLSGASVRHSESRLADWLARGYAALLRAAVRRPAWMLGAAAVVTLGGLAALLQVGSPNLVPALKDRDLLVRWESAPGVSLPEMTRVAAVASKELRSIPGVRNVGAHMGRASTSDKVINVNSADLWVSIDPAADYDATAAAIKQLMLEGYPGLRPEVTTYPNQRVREVTAGTEDDLVVRVYGRDYEVLRAKAETVAKSIAGLPGVVNPQVRMPAFEPTVEIEVVVPKAAAKGVKPGDVRRAAATMLSSITAGNLFEEQKIFDVVVWGMPNRRESLTSIRELLVDTPDGGQVRLGEVADVRIRPNPSVIKHDAVSRYVDVVAQVRGRSLDAVTSDVEAHLGRISFPSEHHVEVLGDAAERQKTQRAVLGYAIAAAAAVFFLLQACFSSWRLAALLFVLLLPPLGGAALGAALRPDISVLSLLGGLAVLAAAARGGILQIRHYQRLEQEERQAVGPGLVLRGSQERFGAIVLSTAGATLTLVPLLVWGSVAGLEILAPLAAVIIGGVLTCALLNLFVLPALYLRFAAPASSAEPHPAAQPNPQ